MVLKTGTNLGTYEIVAPLGAGGMGEVYLARDRKLDRQVAIKAIPEHLAQDADRLARFEREARLLASLNHPGIAIVYGLEEADGRYFLILEYIEGESLRDRISAVSLSWEAATQIAADIADALHAAHAKGLIHRDIKPDNIMITTEGRVKVLDFGLAKRVGSTSPSAATETLQTQVGVVMGTPAYMSPEQLQGVALDHGCDLFSLGVVLFEMVTGQRPFTGASHAALVSSILRDEPTSITSVTPGVPLHLAKVVERCLAKSRQERYGSAAELATDLRSLLHGNDVSVPRPSTRPMVGRDAERAQLQQALARARSGQGELILLVGEPGVGKTYLVQEVLDQARDQGCLAVSGHAYEEDGAPYIISAEILEEMTRQIPGDELRRLLGDTASEMSRLLPALRRRFPDIPPPADLPPEQQRRHLFNCVVEFLERAGGARPMVMLLDDLHWADESSLLLLEHVAQQISTIPVLLLGTYRDVELEVGKPFEKTLARLIRQKLARRLRLRRLTEADIAELFESLGGPGPPESLVTAVYRESEGNPFFATELFEHLAEEDRLFDERGAWREETVLRDLEVPEGVRLVIGRRLQRLRSDTTSVLTAASVIGMRFDLTVLAKTASLPKDAVLDAIEEAISARLVAETSETREACFQFVHAMVRQTLLAAVTLPRRQQLHLKVAEALEETLGDRIGNHVADLAHHLYQAGGMADLARTQHFLALAGQASLDAAAAEEAVNYFNRSLELLELEENSNSGALAELLFQRGQAFRALGRWEDAVRDWYQALPVLEAGRRTELVARICRDLAYQRIWENRSEEAQKLAERGLEAVGEATSISRCRLLAILGYAISVGGDLVASEEVHDRALAMAQELGDEQLLGGEVLLTRLYLYQHSYRPALMAETAERATALARRSGRPWELSNAFGGTFLAWMCQGRFADIEANLDEAMALAKRTGDLGNEWHLRFLKGYLCFSRGALHEGRDCLLDALEFCRTTTFPWASLVEAGVGVVDFYLGEWDSSRQFLGTAMAHAVGGTWRWMECAHHLFVLAYLDPEEAGNILESTIGYLPSAGVPNCAGQWLLAGAFVEAAAWLGRRDLAANMYPLMKQVLDDGGNVCFVLGLTHKLAGIAAAAAGQWDTAAQHFDTGLQQVDELPYRLDKPDMLRWRAWMLLERAGPGDRSRADSFLADANAEYERLGMSRHGEIVADLLTRTSGSA